MPQFMGTPVDDAFFDKATDAAVDITEPEVVEVLSDIARGIIWVNVNGVCIFRACRIKNLTLGTTPVIKDRSYSSVEDLVPPGLRAS